jgi:hypothetical protein
VSRRQALVFSLGLLLAGLLLGLRIGVAQFFIALGLAVVGFFYNRVFKKRAVRQRAGESVGGHDLSLRRRIGGGAVQSHGGALCAHRRPR